MSWMNVTPVLFIQVNSCPFLFFLNKTYYMIYCCEKISELLWYCKWLGVPIYFKKMFSIITFCSAVVSLQAAVYLRIVKPATMEHGELMMTSSWMGSIVLSAVKAGVEGIVKVSKCFNEVFLWGLTKLQKCLILWIIFLNVIADRKTEIMQSLHYEVKMNR